MIRKSEGRRILLMATTVLATIIGARMAQAQEADPGTVGDIVVTATRQASSVNNVPLAVTAASQELLDEKGIRTISDLQSTVPGLRIVSSEGSGVANVAIRGVRQLNATAATTGFYLDETSLQKRSAAGFASQNGTPIPPLFDLERVEVLRGPQGTLFGGGSEGGTVRYIQPSPSLTKYSEYARAEYSSLKDGDSSYEVGAAIGGPIVEDKLGFRISAFKRESGGFIDLTDYRTGKVYKENANSGEIGMGRFALTFAPSSTSKITASYFTSRDETDHNSTTFNLPVPGAVTVPNVCYNVAAISALPQGTPARSNPSPNATGANGAGVGAICAANPTWYQVPGFTLGPLALDDYQSLANGPNPTSTEVQVGSIDAEIDLNDNLTFRSVTSYIHDMNKARQPQFFLNGQVAYGAAPGLAVYTEPGQAPINIRTGLGSFNPNVTASANTDLTGGLALGAYLDANSRNERFGFTQEFRLSSSATARPLSFVAGVFYSNIRTDVNNSVLENEAGLVQLTGQTTQQRYGVPYVGFFSQIQEYDKDIELAAFGDLTWHINERLQATGGIRFTHVETDFYQTNFGPNGGTLNPTVAGGGIVVGSIQEDPVTPKFSIEYKPFDGGLLYFNAAKGFRAGGVNEVCTQVCLVNLTTQTGLTTNASLPKTYESDTVWSYEVGGKFRMLDGKAQINTSIYKIDWSNVQVFQALGGDGFVGNAPSATSKGAEIEATYRPIRALTLNASVAYNKAEYTADFIIPGVTNPIRVTQAGQLFPQPKWTADVGARFEIPISDDRSAYARADYRWADGYLSVPPGNIAFSPDSSIVPESQNLNLRLGVDWGSFDLNVFVNNALDYQEGPQAGGRAQCAGGAADCPVFNQYNPFKTVNWGTPRRIGVQLAYRH